MIFFDEKDVDLLAAAQQQSGRSQNGLLDLEVGDYIFVEIFTRHTLVGVARILDATPTQIHTKDHKWNRKTGKTTPVDVVMKMKAYPLTRDNAQRILEAREIREASILCARIGEYLNDIASSPHCVTVIKNLPKELVDKFKDGS